MPQQWDPRWTQTAPDRRNRSASARAMGAYATMKNEELSAELENRGLAKSGSKDELIARLEEDDAAVHQS